MTQNLNNIALLTPQLSSFTRNRRSYIRPESSQLSLWPSKSALHDHLLRDLYYYPVYLHRYYIFENIPTICRDSKQDKNGSFQQERQKRFESNQNREISVRFVFCVHSLLVKFDYPYPQLKLTLILIFINRLPMSIVMIVGIEDQLPIWIHTFSNLTAHFNSTLNPIVYLIFNPKIRQAYCNVIRLVTCNRFLNNYPGLYSSSARLTGTYCIGRINRLTNKQTIISL